MHDQHKWQVKEHLLDRTVGREPILDIPQQHSSSTPPGATHHSTGKDTACGLQIWGLCGLQRALAWVLTILHSR